MEKEEWKPFRNALSKSDRKKKFDEMWDLPKWYISACSLPLGIFLCITWPITTGILLSTVFVLGTEMTYLNKKMTL